MKKILLVKKPNRKTMDILLRLPKFVKITENQYSEILTELLNSPPKLPTTIGVSVRRPFVSKRYTEIHSLKFRVSKDIHERKEALFKSLSKDERQLFREVLFNRIIELYGKNNS